MITSTYNQLQENFCTKWYNLNLFHLCVVSECFPTIFIFIDSAQTLRQQVPPLWRATAAKRLRAQGKVQRTTSQIPHAMLRLLSVRIRFTHWIQVSLLGWFASALLQPLSWNLHNARSVSLKWLLKEIFEQSFHSFLKNVSLLILQYGRFFCAILSEAL